KGQEDFEESRQEERTEIRQEGSAQEGCQENCQESRQEERAEEEGRGSSDGGSGARTRAGARFELGYAEFGAIHPLMGFRLIRHRRSALAGRQHVDHRSTTIFRKAAATSAAA